MFADKLSEAIQRKQSVLCVGLDLSLDEMPESYDSQYISNLSWWGRAIIDRIADYAVIVKPNLGFYLQYGPKGIVALRHIIVHASQKGLLVILDLKAGDGKKSAQNYANATIGAKQFAPIDAMTLETSIADPGFDEYVKVANETGKGLFLVVRTSFKDPVSNIENQTLKDGRPLWHCYAEMVANAAENSLHGNSGFSNIGAVVGATRSEDALKARELMPHSIFLVPGFGSQGGKATDAVAGSTSRGTGIIANSSSGIVNAWMKHPDCDPLDCVEEAAVQARDSLQSARSDFS